MAPNDPDEKKMAASGHKTSSAFRQWIALNFGKLTMHNARLDHDRMRATKLGSDMDL